MYNVVGRGYNNNNSNSYIMTCVVYDASRARALRHP